MRRNTSLRYVFLGYVRMSTLPSESLARLVLLASPQEYFRRKEAYHVCVETVFCG